MKRFLYSHPLLTMVLLIIVLILPSTGLIIPLILELLKIEMTNWQLLACMLGGPLLTLLIALPFVYVPSLKCLDETLNELWQLKRSRKVFHAPQSYQTIDHAKEQIQQNLCNHKLKKIDCQHYATEAVICEGIWCKDIAISYKYSPTFTHPCHYLLYTTNDLSIPVWELLQTKIDKQLLALETESLRRHCHKPAYAICILCNRVDSAIIHQVQKIQSYQITDAHVCIGVVAQNNWYLPAFVKSSKDTPKLARNILGKGTFGLKTSIFPYKGNTDYTNEFYQKLEHVCNSRLKDNQTNK